MAIGWLIPVLELLNMDAGSTAAPTFQAAWAVGSNVVLSATVTSQ